LENADGCRAQEYRIRDGAVEVRWVDAFAYGDEWKRLTAAELTDHVNRKTVLAQWLKWRLGWRRLLRACVSDEWLEQPHGTEPHGDHRAA
jgi:hypothetical protein